MIKFLLQKDSVNSRGSNYQFVDEVLNAKDFLDWLSSSNIHVEYSLLKDLGIVYTNYTDFIPVGSVEFVEKFISLLGYPIPTPINVPAELYEFAGRFIAIGNKSDIVKNVSEDFFIKSTSKVKGFSGTMYDVGSLDESELYQYSELIDIVSEYRCFVLDSKLVGLKHYSGDFKVFPSMSVIEKMIQVYTDSGNAQVAYTLDIGITSNNSTIIIEVHNFYSCGLYGFNDYPKYIKMLNNWWKKFITNQNN